MTATSDDPTLAWLLDPVEPGVQARTLTDLCGRPQDAPEVLAARAALMEHGPVPAMLAAQREDGGWGRQHYHDKYRGTAWQVLLLAELGADGADPRVARGLDLLLDQLQERESGGFSLHHAARTGGGRRSEVIPCLTGNMVYAGLRLRGLQDRRVQRGLDWILRYLRCDDGVEAAPTGWPYQRAEACWGRHTCHMTVSKCLRALAEVPSAARDAAWQRAVALGTAWFVLHGVHGSSHEPGRVSKPGWLRFGFPLMYQSDTLEVLDTLTALGCHDARLQPAVDAVRAARGADGRWLMRNSYNDKLHAPVEQKGEPSRWVTLRALRVLGRWEAAT